jgi:hypothetical protein
LQPTIDLKESQEKLHDVVHYAATSAKHFTPQDFDNFINQINNEGDINMSTSIGPFFTLLEARGEAKGEARGEAKGKREAILTVLCRRFKMTNVPDEIKSGIMQMNEPIALESLLACALDCQTLDEFAEALN